EAVRCTAAVRPGSEVELVRRQVEAVARLAHDRLLVLVEVAVGAADDDAGLDHGARLGRLLLRLGDLLEHADLAEGEVGGQLVEVVLETPAQVVGGEVLQHVVGADELGDALPLGRVDGAVGRGDQGAHVHARVPEGAALEVVLLRHPLVLHLRRGILETVPQGHAHSMFLGLLGLLGARVSPCAGAPGPPGRRTRPPYVYSTVETSGPAEKFPALPHHRAGCGRYPDTARGAGAPGDGGACRCWAERVTMRKNCPMQTASATQDGACRW